MAKQEIAAPLVVALAFSVIWIGLGSTLVESARERDFLNLYVGASLASEGRFSELHDQAAQFSVQRSLDPEAVELWPFVRPHFYAVSLSWLPMLPFNTAFWTWVALQAGLLAVCWAWAVKNFGTSTLVFSAMYLPTALGIAHGQDCVLMLTVAVAAYSFFRSGKPGWSGAVLALSLFKFHLLLLLPVVICAARERKMLRGYLASAVTLTTLSILLAGTTGVSNYVKMLTDGDLRGLHPSPERTISVFGLAHNLPTPFTFTVAVLIAGVLALVYFAVRDAPAWRWWAAGIVGSLLCVPHIYGYDAGVALLAVWLVFAHGETAATKLTGALCATPLPYIIGLGDAPQSAVPGLALLAFLGSLAWENARQVATIEVESSATATAGQFGIPQLD